MSQQLQLNQPRQVGALRKDITSKGYKIRDDAITLLKETRKYRVGFRDIIYISKQVENFESRYDALYELYIEYDAQMTNYCETVSNPFKEGAEGGYTVNANERYMNALNISTNGLVSQRDTIRTVIQDITNQLNDINNQSNNLTATLLGLLSLFVAIIALVL
jgi:uncharacterized protein YwgA